MPLSNSDVSWPGYNCPHADYNSTWSGHDKIKNCVIFSEHVILIDGRRRAWEHCQVFVLTSNDRSCSVFVCLLVTFVFPWVPMFPLTLFRETTGLWGKQNWCWLAHEGRLFSLIEGKITLRWLVAGLRNMLFWQQWLRGLPKLMKTEL